MILVKIALGLVGLGVVVFVHELGHFLAARLCGIDVEAFSIGWGNPLLKKKVGAVEYRLGMFPIGGYCKMKGETDSAAPQSGASPEAGSYFAAAPWRRALVSFAGPFFNLVFAAAALAVIWGAGFDIQTAGNRIVLASELGAGERFPADEAGLRTGDKITEINGKAVNWYFEIQEAAAVNPDKNLSLAVDRAGEIVRLSVMPALDKSTGAGRIGVVSWLDPLVESVGEGSAASRAGLRAGDVITAINGGVIRNTLDVSKLLEARPAGLAISFTRNGVQQETSISPIYTVDGKTTLGIFWARLVYHSPALSVPQAAVKGAREAWSTLALTVRSFALLFRGIDLTKAVSGPVRITYMMGDIAAEGFGQSAGAGFRSMGNFLALISIALCVMNLLPLPILDGGMIILFIIEMIRRKPLPPKAASVFQTVGMVFIAGLMLFAVFGDIVFLVKR